MRTAFYTSRPRPLLIGLALFAAATACAEALTLNVTQPDQVGPAGATYTFQGMITNDTGHALLTTDLFFDFAGFNPLFITPHQLLGDVISNIPNGATSASLLLFDLGLAAGGAPGTRFSADVLLQDDGGSLSPPVTVSVTVVPEPATSTLLLAGLLSLLWRFFRRGQGGIRGRAEDCSPA